MQLRVGNFWMSVYCCSICKERWVITVMNVANWCIKTKNGNKIEAHVAIRRALWNYCSPSEDLTHWGRDIMDAIWQTLFSNAFPWMKMFQLRLQFYWGLFPKGLINNILTLHGSDNGLAPSRHYLNQWWSVYRRIYTSLGLNELIE